MVAIVTGNGVGLGKSSSEVLGQGGQVGLGQLPGAAGNAYVNAATGNLVIRRQDEVLIGRGPDIGVYQTYNSQGGLDFDNNDNWQVSLYRQLSGLTGGSGVNTVGSTITRTGADGTALVYTYDSTTGSATVGKYINKDGAGSYDTLSYDGTNKVWTWQDGTSRIKESYAVDPNDNSKWRITGVTDLDNNSLTYTYSTTSGLTSLIDKVTSANGEVTQLIYNATKQLTQINVINSSNVTTTRIRYNYESTATNARLTSVSTDLTPADGSISDDKIYTTSYTYDGSSKRITSITNSDGSKVSFTYEQSGDYRLLSINEYSTNSDSISNATTLNYTSATTTTVTTTNNAGTSLVTTLTYDATSKQLTNVQGPSGSGQNVSYTYNANGDVTQVTDSRGNWTKYSYDAQGNQVTQQDNLGNTIVRTYDSTAAGFNQLLTETVYTGVDATPGDASIAGTGTVQTTRYTYDSKNHVRFTISAEGRVTEYRYNANGQLTSTHQYTDHLFTTTGNQTEAQMNTWLTAAIKSKSQRTDYLYDARGQLSETVVYTKVNATTGNEGNGIADGTQMRIQYVYDQSGNLKQKIDARGVATTGTVNDYLTSYAYDGLNRLKLTKQYDATGLEANAVATQVTYTDASRQVSLTLANGLVTTSTYDLAGRLLTVQKSDAANPTVGSLGTTSYAYDKLGNLRSVTNELGKVTYYLYDNANRKVGEIDENKNLTEWVYNNNGQVVRTIQYKNAVTATLDATTALTNTLATNGIRSLDSTNNRTSYKIYDQAGRLAKEIDALGYVTEYQYDGTSRLLKTIEYANALTTTQLNAINAANGELQPADSNTVPVADATNDRAKRNLYDNDGKLVGTLDAEGYLTEYIYDKAGRQIQKTVYATVTAVGNRANGTLAQLKADATSVSADTTKHQTTNYIYDAAGQLTGMVDAEGYLTEYQYDLAGNKTQEIRYATNITYVAGNTVEQSRPASNNEDQKVTNAYDQNNRITSSLSNSQGQVNGLLTNYTYDSVGNLKETVKTFTGATSAQQRVQRNQYDSRGNLIAQLSGEGVVALLALGTTPTQSQIDAIWAQYGTRYTYDNGNRLLSKVEPNGVNATGNKTLYYYDNEGKLTYTVNALGEVSQTVYNSFDQVAETRRYNTRIASTTLSGLVGGDDSAMTSVINGIGATNFSSVQAAYDQAGQRITSTDELGNINSRRYNAFGELKDKTDKIDSSTSVVTSYQYDRRGSLKQTKEDDGGINRITSAIYDAFGRVTQTTDGRNNTQTYQYDKLGRTIVTTNGLSQSTTIGYDAFDRKVSQVDGRGNPTTWVYNTTNRSMTMTTPEGISVITERNAFGEVVKVTDGRGSITSYQYNTDGQLTNTIEDSGSAAGKLNLSTSTTYDKAGRVYQTKDARGTVTQYSYDAANRVLSKTIDPTSINANGLNLSSNYRYDAQGRQIWIQDANGIWTRMDYDAKGQLSQVVTDPADIPTTDANGLVTGTATNANALNLITRYSYDARGKKLSVTEGYNTTSARTTQYVYDKLGRLTSTIVDPGTNKLNLTTSYTYDQNDNVVLKTDAKGNKTVYSYDAEDRLVYTVDALGYITKNDYDGNGNIVKVRQYKTALAAATLTTLQGAPSTTSITPTDSSDDRVTRYAYDKDNRRTYITDAEWYVTRNEYDANGNVVKRTQYATKATVTPDNGSAPTVASDAVKDRVTQTVYDAADRATYSVDAQGYVTANRYDANGNVVSTTRYATVMVGTLSTNTPPQILTAAGSGNYVVTSSNDQIARYSYDGNNRRSFSMEANGSVTRYEYDKLGNTVKVTRYSNAMIGTPVEGSSPAIVTAIPGSGSYVLKDDNKDQVTQQRFDKAGRKTEAIDGNGKSTKTEYNAAGDIVKITDALGNVGYFYTDGAGRVTLQVDPEGAVTQTQYDGLGNATQVLRFANKVQTSGTGVLNTSASIQVVSTAPGGNSVYVLTDSGKDQKQTTEYDKLGQKLTVKTWTGATTSTATTDYYTEGYTYTAFGEIQTQTARNGLVTTYTYDKQGRKRSESFAGILVRNPADNGTVTLKNSYSYNGFGDLVTKIEADGAKTTRTTTYGYDKLGRQQQTSQVVQTTTGATGSAISQKTYDARGNVVSEKDPNGNWTYTYYDKQDRRTASVKADGSYTIWSYDAVGNISQQTQYANKVQTIGTATLSASSSIQLVSTAPTSGNVVYLLIDAANDRTTLYTYDKVGRQTGTEIQNITTGVYNTASNQYQVSTGSITTKTEYDALGNIIKQTDGNGNVTRSWYNKAGQLVAKLDPENYLTVWKRDVYGNISQETRYANKVQTIGTATYTDSGIPTIVTTAPTTGNSVYVVQDNTNDRTTILNYDKLNRVSSETVNNVQAGSVNATTGVLTNPTAVNATTSYKYDGLNNIIQKTDATSAVTDWVYDGLGRQLSEIKPQFTDYEGSTVRSRTDKEYDGLNNVTRELRRGKDNATASTLSGQVETDDQITTYTYGIGGRLISEKDATNAETQYEYDLNGNITKQTLKNRQTIDQVLNSQAGADDVKTYTYDSLNRQTKTTDLGTTVVQEVQYNSFNQITGKRTYTTTTAPQTATTWDEYTQYDRTGRVWKSNSGDGVTKVYVNDNNGNATATISSTVDMQNMTLADVRAVTGGQTLYTFSVYDMRNKVITTVQPNMESLKETAVIQANTSNQGTYVGSNSTITVSSADVLQTIADNPVLPSNSGNILVNSAGTTVTISAQPVGSAKAAMYYRKAGSGNYTFLRTIGFPSGQLATTFSFRKTNGQDISRDLYDLQYIVMNAAGVVINRQSCVLDTRNASAATISSKTTLSINGTGFAMNVLRADIPIPNLYLFDQTGADSITLRYRIKGSNSSWLTTVLSKTGGNLFMPGGFYTGTTFSIGTYELDFSVRDNDGVEIRRMRGELTRSSTADINVSSLTPYSSVAAQATVTISERNSAKYIDVSYRRVRSPGQYSTVRLSPTVTGSGIFKWDVSSLVSDPYGYDDYEIIVNSFELGDVLSNEIEATVRLGVDASILGTPTNYADTQRLRIALGSNVEQSAAQTASKSNANLATQVALNPIFQSTSESTSGLSTLQEAANASSFAAIKADGSVVAWGDPRYGGDISTVASKLDGRVPVSKIYATGGAFAALRVDGTVVTWGGASAGGNSDSVATQLSDPTNQVKRIYSSQTVFAALRADGSVVTWGGASTGGASSIATFDPTTNSYNYVSIASQLNGSIPVTQIYSNGNAFAALRADGSVVTWGNSSFGGNSSVVSSNGSTNQQTYVSVANQLNGSIKVTQIYANAGAFVALRVDGSIVTWGKTLAGGNSSVASYDFQTGVTNETSVAAQLNNPSNKVKVVYATKSSSFAAQLEDGSIVTWGDSVFGGNSGINTPPKASGSEYNYTSVAAQLNDSSNKVVKIFSNDYAFAALRADGSVVTWGDASRGGGSSITFAQTQGSGPATYSYTSVTSQLNDSTNKVVKIFSNTTAFAALRADGSVVTWGYSSDGGDSSLVSSMLNGSIPVTSISDTRIGFSALRADGSVVTWGRLSYNGAIITLDPSKNRDFVKVYKNSFAFAGLRADGSIETWGDANYGGYSSTLDAKLSSGIVALSDITQSIFITSYNKTLKITQPAGVSTVKVLYRPTGSTSAYQTSTISTNTNGVFDWVNTLSMGDYEVLIQGFDAQGNPKTQMGYHQLRFSYEGGNEVKVTSMTDIFKFDLGYRLKGSDADYTPIAATAYSVNGKIEYRASLPEGLAAGDYEYRYTAYGADTWETDYELITTPDNPNTPEDETVYGAKVITHPLGDGIGYFTVNGTTTVASRLDWVITTSNQTNTIQRSQQYNAFGEVIQETDGNGNVTNLSYNNLGKVTSKRDPQVDITLANGYIQTASEGSRPETSYTYDLAGRLIAIKDANNNLNTQVYLNGSDDVLFERHADGGFVKRSYDVFGNLKSETDRINSLTDTGGRTTQYSYDKENRLTQITRPSTNVESYVYDAAGNRISHTNAAGDTEKTYYDASGRVTKTTSYQGFSTTYSYTYNGAIVGVGGNMVGGWIKTTTDALGRTLIDQSDMSGRVTWHQDLGGHQFTYTYTQAGWLKSQVGTSGQNISYDYYANGYIKSIWDKALGVYTTYKYDNNGNRTFEGYVALNNPLNLAAGVKNYYEYANITYDSLNRIKQIVDPKATISYEYDAVGNRRHVNSMYHDGLNGSMRVQDLWYTYDSMNRFTVTMGSLAVASTGAATTTRGTSATDTSVIINKGAAGGAGSAISYNLAGQRTQAINAIDGTTEDYVYNTDGYLTDVTINGVLRSRRTNDALGRVRSYIEYNSSGSQIYVKNTDYDKDNRITNESGTDGTSTYYYYTNSNDNSSQIGQAGAAAGVLARVTNVNSKEGSTTTTHTYYGYEYWDEAKQTAITTSASNTALKQNNQYWQPGFSDLFYDVNGHLNRVYDRVGNRDIKYVTDAQGQILVRNEIDAGVIYRVHRYYYVDGQRVGDVSNDGPSRTDYAIALAKHQAGLRATSPKGNYDKYIDFQPIASADFDQNYEPVSPTYPGPVSTTYTIKSGDTLQSIARTVWGDADMWYLLADANGLTSSNALTAGQVLTIPNKVTNIHNNSGTYRVYNPGEAIGDVNPTLPDAPPPPAAKRKKKGCGGIGMILVAVVAVVATIATAGVLAGPAAIAANGGVLGAGAAALGGSVAGFGFGAAAVAGAVGSITSQVAGISLGVQDKFSWGAVATAGLTAGVLSTGPMKALTQAVGGVVGGGYAAVATRAVVGNVVGQGIGNITGTQKGFNWSSVAISGIGAAAGAAMSDQFKLTSNYGSTLSSTNFGADLGRAAVSAGSFALTQLVVKGGKVNWQQVATDTVTNLIQNQSASSAAKKSALETPTYGDTFDEDTRARKQALDSNRGEKESTSSSSPILLTDDEVIANALVRQESKTLNAFKKELAQLPIAHAKGLNVDVRGIVKEQIAAGEYGSPAFSGASWDPSVTEQATFTGYDDQVLSGTPWDPSKTERPALSGYDKFSIGAHITLSALGAIPVVGVGADLVDFGYTLGEKAFGKASWTDVSLSGAAIVASVLPGADQAADVAKVSRQLEKMAVETKISPRLTQRLEAWRSYRSNGGEMEMQQWMRATQRQYGGVSGGYKSGFNDWVNGLDGIHGNNLLAKGPHDVYVIRNANTGELLHFGETGRGYLIRFTEHQRMFAKDGLEIDVDLLRTVQGKAAAKEVELKYIQTYNKVFGKRPPYNPVNH